jgi:hypothetical protein
VKFEVPDIRESESHTLYRYIVNFIHNATQLQRTAPAAATTANAAPTARKLKKMQEYDPELYDLARHGSKKLYSTICQNPRQPIVYTADEVAKLPRKELDKLTEYWNFTLNTPAYYGCPSARHPHLSFIVGKHPKHYCMPCCNKRPVAAPEPPAKDKPRHGHERARGRPPKQDAAAAAVGKKAMITAECLRTHKFIESELDDMSALSRHVISYGKDVTPERLSRPPGGAFGEMMQNAPTTHLFLYGVEQELAGVADSGGVVHSIAAALDTNAGKLVATLARQVVQAPAVFETLLGGEIAEHYSSATKFAADMRRKFVAGETGGSDVQRDDETFARWPDAIVELT